MKEGYIGHSEEFATGNDPGDENDSRQARLDALMEIPELRFKIATALRVVSQAHALPPDIVAAHKRFLDYWKIPTQ